MNDAELFEACARAAHEANRAYCIAHNDMSQVSWEDAPEWQKKSARDGILVALGGATPEEQHQAWKVSKVAEGWKYGPVKDAEKKEHPCIVPYEQLPAMQRKKDDLFIAVVNAMASALGV